MNSSTNTASFIDGVATLGGHGLVHLGLKVIVSTITLIVASAMVGFWMAILLALIAFVIKLLSTFVLPMLEDLVSDETKLAIGTKAIAGVTWVTQLFAAKTEEVAA